ncbi:hypothetical protein SNEBB_005291 [Seison nebaliae]|nr:hypothetical protein SNEBB_005291 [Seison nebaliae]
MTISIPFVSIFSLILLQSYRSISVLKNDGTGLYDNDPYVVDLTDKTFSKVVFENEKLLSDGKLINSTSKLMLVEFYSAWCGHCQHYASTYSALGVSIKNWNRTVCGITAVNCASTTNNDICNTYDVSKYPTIRLFPYNSTEEFIVNHMVKATHEIPKLHQQSNDVYGNVDFVENAVIEAIETESYPNLINKKVRKCLQNDFSSIQQEFDDHPSISTILLIVDGDRTGIGKKISLDLCDINEHIQVINVPKAPIHVKEILRSFLRKESDCSSIIDEEEKVWRTEIIRYVDRDGKAFLIRRQCPKHISLVTPDGMASLFNMKTVDSYEGSVLLSNQLLSHIRPSNRRHVIVELVIRYLHELNTISSIEYTRLSPTVVKRAPKTGTEHQADVPVRNFKRNDHMYMADIESALHFMLRNEISSAKLIKGKRLYALRKWLFLLANYFPGRNNVKSFLYELYMRIMLHKFDEGIAGREFKRIVNVIHEPGKFLPKKVQWFHCRGSQKRYRGYPCAVWMLFHTIIANQQRLEMNSETARQHFQKANLLFVLKDYVISFFGCNDCVKNFLKETAALTVEVKKSSDSLLYFWKVHNSVNKRLHTDITEDPYAHKIQFPPPKMCPKCRLGRDENDKIIWDRTKVKRFLLDRYDPHNWSYEHVLDLEEGDYDPNAKNPYVLDDWLDHVGGIGKQRRGQIDSENTSPAIVILMNRKLNIFIFNFLFFISTQWP